MGVLKKEQEHLAWVASHPCCVCGFEEVEIHHVREFGERRDHFKTIPLCYLHHRGVEGIHYHGKKKWSEFFGNELDMLKTLQEN